MSSATKTLQLLAYFTSARPEIGLSALCRLAGRDKATTYRHLQALEDVGFVEQNPISKNYRLGPAVLQLAQVREATVPRKAAAEAALSQLADATGETSHVSVLSGGTLYALMTCEGHRHSTRVIIDVDTLELHATASGLCALAFGPAELLETLDHTLPAFTSETMTDKADVARAVTAIRESGFARSDRHYGEDTHSFAAPVFDATGHLAGTVAVACVATRITSDLAAIVTAHLAIAAREISRNWGGSVPREIEAAWARTIPLAQSGASTLDIAS